MSDSHLIDWQDGQPVSKLYGDVFFSRASGIEETRHVFLAANRLEDRWRALPTHSNFIIGETGFGTGLNFLCAWQLWQECAPADAWLHFFSVEKHPLSAAELKAALELWPQLAEQRDALLAQYDEALPSGWHRFVFPAGRITLTLAIDDVVDALTQLDVQADAWFLDGFAPSRNPEMWSQQVLQEVARHTKPGGTFATYSAAGEVRRTLEAAGFAVERIPGHGSKREMVRGTLCAPAAQQDSKPWFKRPTFLAREKRAIVIGGGLAGTGAAFSLAIRGWQVKIIERHARLAAEASGNDQGILYARLSGHPTTLRALVIAGYSYSNRLLKQTKLTAEDYAQCGVLQLAFDEEEAKRQAQLLAQHFHPSFFHAVDAAQATALCGVDVRKNALFFPQGGWLHPPALCAAFADHPNITVRLHTEALRLEKSGEQWQVCTNEECIAEAEVLIIAGAGDSLQFEQSAHLPLTTIRGQITALPETPLSARLRTVICGEGYIAPARKGLHTLGATHKFRDDSIEVRDDEHIENIETLRQLLPELSVKASADLSGRAAIRSSSPDYLPIIGPMVEAAAFNAIYAALSRDATLTIDTAAPWAEGLYVCAAHGSRGLVTTPLAGELLAAYLNNEPSPLPKAVTDALHPSRFPLRDLIRRRACL